MIGTILRILRKEKGLTQRELGKMLGLADTTISAYETGKISPDFDIIVGIFKICDFDIRIINSAGDIFTIDKFIKKFNV